MSADVFKPTSDLIRLTRSFLSSRSAGGRGRFQLKVRPYFWGHFGDNVANSVAMYMMGNSHFTLSKPLF